MLRASSSPPNVGYTRLLYRLHALLEKVRFAWLVVSSGHPWYRGGVRGWAGASGRLDIVARVFAAAGYPGCQPLDTLLVASLSGPALLIHKPSQGIECSEVGLGERILCALEKGDCGDTLLIPGLGWREAVAAALSAGLEPLTLLEGCGRRRLDINGRLVVIGADIDPPRIGECASIGPRSYLASTVVYTLYAMNPWALQA